MVTDDSIPFVTGMGYRKICDYIYDEFYQFDINNIDQFDNMKIFVKTDFLFDFEFKILPKINRNFILYTHNSDLCIDNKYLSILNNIFLVKWYGQNINTVHDKLQSIPIGLANKRWQHGNVEILKKIISENNKKDNMIYCNMDINTNYAERTNCLQSISPIQNSNRVNFETYLRNVSKSYFVISPNGNGIDCHKTWESFYLKSVPIITESINSSYYKDYPFLILNKWSDFNKIDLNIDLYNQIINNKKSESWINL